MTYRHDVAQHRAAPRTNDKPPNLKMITLSAEHLRKDVEIALVGKYTKLEDAYASVIKALNHASLALNYRLRLTYIAASDLENNTKKSNPVQFHEAWKTLCQCQGVLIPGRLKTY